MAKNQLFKYMQQELFTNFKGINREFFANGIIWWAHSGTLLGFIREKGMIKWDDDIDMAMSYRDYVKHKEKIIEIAERYGFDVLDPITNTGIDTVKLVKKQERIVEWNDCECLFKPTIDIMLAIPNNSRSSLKGKIKSIPMKLSFIYQNKFDFLPKNGWVFGKLRKIPKFFNYLIFPFKIILYPISVPIVKFTFWKSLRKKDWSSLSMYYNYPHKGKIYSKRNLRTFRVNKDLEVIVSKDYREELSLWYGNWNELPSMKERVPKHLLLNKI